MLKHNCVTTHQPWEPHHQYSLDRALFRNHTSVRNANLDEMTTNKMNQCIQYGGNEVQNTLTKHDTLEVPGLQTQNPKAPTQLQKTILKNNSQNDDWRRYFNSNRNFDHIKKSLKSQRNWCQNSQHLEKFDKSKHSIGFFILSKLSISILNIDTNNEMDFVLNNVQDDDSDNNKSNKTDHSKNCRVLI